MSYTCDGISGDNTGSLGDSKALVAALKSFAKISALQLPLNIVVQAPTEVETTAGVVPHLVVPYTLDTNDMRFAAAQGFNSGDQFFSYLKDSFDVLYAEGAKQPKMMSIGLHCRLVGRPGRAAALARFLDYIQSHDRVWICRRIDIANHWIEHHPYKPSSSKG